MVILYSYVRLSAAPVAPEAPRVSTPKTKPARERVVLVNEAGEPVQSSPPKPSTPKPKKQATPAKVYVKPTTTETASKFEAYFYNNSDQTVCVIK